MEGGQARNVLGSKWMSGRRQGRRQGRGGLVTERCDRVATCRERESRMRRVAWPVRKWR